jgi:hypothetical protein
VELFEPVIEGDQLGGANKGEVQGIEEENGPFLSDIVVEVEILHDGSVGQNGGSGEVGGFFGDDHSISLFNIFYQQRNYMHCSLKADLITPAFFHSD